MTRQLKPIENPSKDLVNAMDLVITQKKHEAQHAVLMQAYARKVWETIAEHRQDADSLDFTDVRRWY